MRPGILLSNFNLKTKKMKKIILKISLFTMVLFFAQRTTVNAQNSPDKKTVTVHNNNFTSINTKNGTEKIRTSRDGKVYELAVVNEQITSFSIDGKIIPKASWGEYSKEIAVIREQLAVDKIQAKKDQQQAQLDQQQATRDQQQAQKDQKNALLDQQQAKRDQQQARKDQEQAKRDQQQARKDQQQAVKDQQQAAADQKLLNALIGDLISDHIIPNKKALLNLTLNSAEMRVNGQMQPGTVFNRYKEKYSRVSGRNFYYSYSGEENRQNMLINTSN